MHLTGRRLAQYEVAEEISRGGMGVVYRATDTRLNRDVALKVLPEDLVDDAERRRRFVQEAQAASAIEHPHIAVIYDVNEADGLTFIAMELIRGEKLSAWLGRGRPTVARALEVAAEIASGLAKAHDRQIVHRDLKPANVMLTDEGHAKVIDFGIAKLIEPTADGGLETRTSHDTGVGVVLGTMTYMSPEQARGDRVDYRSDIFSFGIVLHEMLAGTPPFKAKSDIETAGAILHAPAPRLPDLGTGLLADVTPELQRILDKCLAKDAGERYQSMKDVAVDLRAARRRLETGTHPSTAPQLAVATRAERRWLWPAAAVVVLAAAAGAWMRFGGSREVPAAAAGPGSAKPSVAVLYFDNTTGDESLDWMRTGITDMVVTDLSQSTQVEVVSTEHLYGILAELKRADDKVLSPEVIRAVAERTGVQNVVVGSFVRSGEALRINVRLQEATTGRIVSSERVDGPNAGSLFAMVDDLSRRIRARFDEVRSGAGPIGSLLTPPGAAADTALDRGLTDVTTPSIEAYQAFAEGMNQHLRFRERQALPHFERAVALDPGFANAHAKLGVVHGNLGRVDLRQKYLQLALEHADRMTAPERLYTEGLLALDRRQPERSVDAYQRCIDLYPGHEGCRHALALLQAPLGQVEESTRNFEELIRRGGTFPTTFSLLAVNYRSLDQPDKALEIVQQYSTRNPENAAGHGSVCAGLIGVGRYRDAAAACQRSAVLSPNATGQFGEVVAQMLQEDWEAARKVAVALSTATEQGQRFSGAHALAIQDLFHGKAADARQWAERAAAVYDRPVPNATTARLLLASIERATGRHAEALAVAERALRDAFNAVDQGPATLSVASLRGRSGRTAQAHALLAEFEGTATPLTAKAIGRLVTHGRGEVALAARDYATALRELTAARSALTSRPGNPLQPSQHVLLWFALGEAHLGAGDRAEARGWFERIVNGSYERVLRPIEYVRSLYHLATIAEAAGDDAKAVEYYRRFLGYWGDGEIDRDKVEIARRKLRAQS
jgi:TolB-like protein/tetratricopeptide (TPR) repeat protein/predicted Ser/Thr protein kinase